MIAPVVVSKLINTPAIHNRILLCFFTGHKQQVMEGIRKQNSRSRVLAGIPVSVLDLATIVQDESAGDALRRSLRLAQKAEALGYTRYWFAEHHNMESVASSATAVLIGYVAGGTSTIRVGAGGVMLPNHAPLIIAEQFGTLASLYTGRIDLGLGRAPGTDPLTSYALRRSLKGEVDDFPNDVAELISYFGPKDATARIRAVPGEGTEVPVWLLGSSTYSAQLAALMGLPFAFASHFAPTYLMEALSLYRERFQPSQYLSEPYSMACVNVTAADTDEEANFLATSLYQMALGMVRNQRRPLPPPVASMDSLWSEPEKAAISNMTQYAFIGSVPTVKAGLQSFLERTGVDEIMITSHIYSLEEKMHCYELVAPLFNTAVEGRNV
jgi:luciferase family oxidoreductase group 1